MPQPYGPPLFAAIYADITAVAADLQSHAKAHRYALFKKGLLASETRAYQGHIRV
jgi:hypothetical protein